MTVYTITRDIPEEARPLSYGEYRAMFERLEKVSIGFGALGYHELSHQFDVARTTLWLAWCAVQETAIGGE
jgi:hypothetical protein